MNIINLLLIGLAWILAAALVIGVIGAALLGKKKRMI